jgi:hypothetical protein
MIARASLVWLWMSSEFSVGQHQLIAGKVKNEISKPLWCFPKPQVLWKSYAQELVVRSQSL